MNEPTVSTTEDLIAALGGPATQDPPAGGTEPPAQEPPAGGTEPPATSGTPEPEPQQQQQQPPANDKTNQAFAQMRTQNKQLSETLKGVAKTLGIENFTDEADLVNQINAKNLAKEAETQKVPVELLSRLHTLEMADQQRVAQQLEQKTAFGFQKLANTYGLDQAALNAWAVELTNNGKNPFVDPNVDVFDEYRLVHYDDIIQMSVQKAITAEQARAAAAAQQSTNPGNTQGTTQQGEPTKVNSVQQLANWFNSQK